jgi:hypothetical protein
MFRLIGYPLKGVLYHLDAGLYGTAPIQTQVQLVAVYFAEENINKQLS